MSSSTLWVTTGIVAGWNIALLLYMGRLRIDHRPSGSASDGASQIAEFNVLNPKNYSRRGQQLLPLLVLSQLLLVGLILVIVFS